MTEAGERPRFGRDCLPRPASARSVPLAIGRLMVALAVLLAAAVLVPVVTLAPGHSRERRAAAALQLLSRVLLRVIGVRVRRRGTPARGPSLVVANNGSWLDMLVLASEVSMVPLVTSEVARRPLVGGLARRLGVLFVRRRHQRELPATVAQATAMLRRGHRVQVFPESTTGRDGSPQFHRAMFQAAVDAAVVIAPAALGYRTSDGRPSDAVPFVGHDLQLTSVWRILRGGAVTATVCWPPVIPAAVGAEHRSQSRALAAWRTERVVAAALGRVAGGRPPLRRTAEDPHPRPLSTAA